MNFEVSCLDFVDDKLQVVRKEYFDTYTDVQKFEQSVQDDYWGVSVKPLTEAAERIMIYIERSRGM